MSPTRLFAASFLCVSLNAAAGFPFMSETVSWNEEVSLSNGQLLLVHRDATYGPDEWGRSGRGRLKKQSIHFSLDGKKVNWENNDKWPFDYMPDILDVVGNTPVLVMPVHRWGPCNKYDFPQEGLVAFAFKNEIWRRIPLVELPANLKVNLLRSTHDIRYWKEFKGKLITPQDKVRLEKGAGWGGTKPGQSILEAGKFYVAAEESCARIHPLPNPQQEEAAEQNIRAETNAPILTAKVKHSSGSPQTVSSDDYRKTKGNWTGSGSLSSSCKGIVEGIESIRQYRDGGAWHMVGYSLILKNGNQIPIKQPGIQSTQAPALMEVVVCSESDIFAIKRRDKEQLIVHRFTQTGNPIDALRVNLPNISQFIPEEKWPMVWEVQVTKENLTITLGNYSYTNTAEHGGVLEQQVTYAVQLPK